MTTFEEIGQLAERFTDEYLRPPYDEYIGMVGYRPIRKAGNLEWRLMVGIKKKIPEEITLPSEYHGVKVFYQSCGEIKPY